MDSAESIELSQIDGKFAIDARAGAPKTINYPDQTLKGKIGSKPIATLSNIQVTVLPDAAQPTTAATLIFSVAVTSLGWRALAPTPFQVIVRDSGGAIIANWGLSMFILQCGDNGVVSSQRTTVAPSVYGSFAAASVNQPNPTSVQACVPG